MATADKIRNDIAKIKEKITELQKRQRTLENQLSEEENRMVKAVKMDNKELTAFLKAYASGLIVLPESMMADDENSEMEDIENEA